MKDEKGAEGKLVTHSKTNVARNFALLRRYIMMRSFVRS